MITHTSDSNQIPSQNKTKSKLQILKKLPKIQILHGTLQATHLLKVLDKMYKYEMDPTKIEGATERTQDAGRTDGQTDGRTEWNQHTSQQLRCARGYNKNVMGQKPWKGAGLSPRLALLTPENDSNPAYEKSASEKSCIWRQYPDCWVAMASAGRVWRQSGGLVCVNFLSCGRYGCDIKLVIFKLISTIHILSISCETALRQMQQDLTDHQSILVQVMAWCCQATSH